MRSHLQLHDINQRITKLQTDPPQAYAVNSKQQDVNDAHLNIQSSPSALTMEAMPSHFNLHQPTNHTWVLDSGASTHMSRGRTQFVTLQSSLQSRADTTNCSQWHENACAGLRMCISLSQESYF